MRFDFLNVNRCWLFTIIFAAPYLLFHHQIHTSIFFTNDISTTGSTKYGNVNSSNHCNECIYCKATQNRKHYSNLCQDQYTFTSSNDTRLLLFAKQLMKDSDNLNQCPIAFTDSLYPYVSSMIESSSSIFHQISLIETAKKILYNSTSFLPPKWHELSPKLQNEYTFNSTIPVEDWYIDKNIQNGNTKYHLHWRERRIRKNIFTFKKTGRIKAPYGAKPANDFYQLLTDSKYAQFIKDSNSIVIGSQQPWLEVLLLASDVSHVTTAEYGFINMKHPKMSYIHPSEFNENYTDVFDVAVQFSSLEHAGMGRYGDPIDPIGDIKMMNQISCLVKPNGLFFYGTPTSDDCIAWNAHRYYGTKRLRLMFMHWKIIDVVGDFDLNKSCQNQQPWFVLQNKRGCFGGG